MAPSESFAAAGTPGVQRKLAATTSMMKTAQRSEKKEV
jgi:hypothetical protein